MNKYLTPNDVAERLKVSLDTARSLMLMMNCTVIGDQRKRRWVSETEFNRFMAHRQTKNTNVCRPGMIPRRKD